MNMDVLGEICAEEYQGTRQTAAAATHKQRAVANPIYQHNGRPAPLWKQTLDETVKEFELTPERRPQNGNLRSETASRFGHDLAPGNDCSAVLEERDAHIGIQMTNALCRLDNRYRTSSSDSVAFAPPKLQECQQHTRKSPRLCRSGLSEQAVPRQVSGDSESSNGYASNPPPRAELPRKRFTEYQTQFLRSKFLKRWFYPYFEQDEMEELANKIGLRKSQVHDWIRTNRARKWRNNVPSHVFELVEVIRQQRYSFWVTKECFSYAFGERKEVSSLPIDATLTIDCETCRQKHTEFLKEAKTGLDMLPPIMRKDIPFTSHIPVALSYCLIGLSR
eukprot:gb/GECG01009558.1/.p1 GENE.gb/GECG01009558.1/~~gb/GECG01009558.1/.p1  ORF type:complete len:334 (+),score=37.18 gb/GECG01009558.1/:1-1002(+)